jgi:hypothetical protein
LRAAGRRRSGVGICDQEVRDGRDVGRIAAHGELPERLTRGGKRRAQLFEFAQAKMECLRGLIGDRNEHALLLAEDGTIAKPGTRPDDVRRGWHAIPPRDREHDAAFRHHHQPPGRETSGVGDVLSVTC